MATGSVTQPPALLEDPASSVAPNSVDVRSCLQSRSTPLDAGHIRLLQIISASDSGIVCEMTHHDLLNLPTFFALSYVCGDGQPNTAIYVSGEQLSITRHLSEAMRVIASFVTREGYQGAWIWIDAICIDQSNLEEKAIQVPLMSKIYGLATMVLVWLGDLDDRHLRSFRVFEWLYHYPTVHGSRSKTTKAKAKVVKRVACLERLLAESGVHITNLNAFREVMGIVDGCRDRSDVEAKLEVFRESATGIHLWPEDHDMWFSLFQFFSHPYFSRVWTIQETRLAGLAIILADESWSNWYTLMRSREALHQWYCQGTLYSWNISHRVNMLSGLYFSVNLRDSARFTSRGALTNAEDFFWLLTGTQLHKAQERKDFIYGGILGMVDESIKSQITIDYSGITSTEVGFNGGTDGSLQS